LTEEAKKFAAPAVAVTFATIAVDTAVQRRLFDDADITIELRVQAILSSRRRANASGQDGQDIDNIRAAIRSVTPNAQISGPRSGSAASDC
jgi:hypothetical protein